MKLQAGEHQSYSNIDVTKQQSFTITVSDYNNGIKSFTSFVLQFDDSGHTWRGLVKVWDKMENDKIVVFNSDDKVDGKSLEQVAIVTVARHNHMITLIGVFSQF